MKGKAEVILLVEDEMGGDIEEGLKVKLIKKGEVI